ncbi:MAG: acyl-CoA dehydrogenase family protein [Gammaproteobacteria bacterium]
MKLSTEQQQLWDMLGRVGMEKFRPQAFDRRFTEFARPSENLRLLGELGVLGICMPEDVGGSQRPDIEGVLAIERISQACPVTGSFAVMAIGGPPIFIAKWGTDKQKRKYIPPILSGDASCSISLTEPEAGTDLAALATRAEIKGERCIINGRKVFCSGADSADFILVYVRFGKGTKGIGAVIVDRDTPGFVIGKKHHHFSGKPWCELYFDNAEIPRDNVLFDGDAFSNLMSSYSLERCAGAVHTLGVARIALDLALEYAGSRTQFGRPICEFQMTQARLANMYMALEGARLLLYKAVAENEPGVAARLDSSVAMVAGVEAASYVCEQAMNVFGGSGMSTDLPLEWLYRIARSYWPAGGTSDIHRSMIAAELLGRRFDQRKQG